MQDIGLGRLLLALSAAAALAFAPPVRAQDYPAKLVRIVVPFSPGSLTDTLARLVAEKLQGKWGQSVIVENRAGAAGNIGAEVVFKAAPDGYTLMFSPPAPFVSNKLLYAKLAYDPDAFVPVSVIAIAPVVLGDRALGQRGPDHRREGGLGPNRVLQSLPSGYHQLIAWQNGGVHLWALLWDKRINSAAKSERPSGAPQWRA